MLISIVIPTFNRAQVFRECLESFYISLRNIKIPYEIIVVINGTDRKEFSDSIRVAKNFRKRLKIKIAATFGRVGSAKARNIGLKLAKGDIIFFFDDDIEILPHYFNEVLPFFSRNDVGGVGAAEIKNNITPFHKIWFKIRPPGKITDSGEIISNFFYDPNLKKVFYVDHLHGSNFGLKKEIIEKIGLFDVNYVGIQREETDFIYRVKKLGYKLIFVPFTGVIHKQSTYGGNVPPTKKREWCYWYHRNTSYFFFKNLYEGKKLRLIKFLIREFVFSIVKTLAYRNIFYVTEFPKIYEGYKLYKFRKVSF
jgi:GT2 family glycosyltransferase